MDIPSDRRIGTISTPYNSSIFCSLRGGDSRRFTKDTADEDLICNLGDLEDTSSDPLATKVRGVFASLVQHLGLSTPGMKILQESKRSTLMPNWPQKSIL